MITRRDPESWKELQELVACILRQCGFTAEVEKTVRTARGQVELDVYAEETINGRRYVVVCECKHWRASVPQSIVHSFRTVLYDLGANLGYLISSSPFQSGAIAAVELTNIRLLTWQEFQGTFEASWLQSYFLPELSNRLQSLLMYNDPYFPEWARLREDQEARIEVLNRKHASLVDLVRAASLRRTVSVAPIQLPVRSADQFPSSVLSLPAELLDETGYSEFLDLLIFEGEKAAAEYAEALREQAREPV